MSKWTRLPLVVKANAGLPDPLTGEYNISPAEFAEYMEKMLDFGVKYIGGCCGTTPSHIKGMYEKCKDIKPHPITEKNFTVVSSYGSAVLVDKEPVIIGERINPTGKKKLQEELREGKLDLVRTMAMEQEANGAAILDVNMGMNGIDELSMMKEAIYEVTSTVDCPLCIDSSYVDVIEEALRIYPGRASGTSKESTTDDY